MINQIKQNSNWKKILGFRNMQEKLETHHCTVACSTMFINFTIFDLPYQSYRCTGRFPGFFLFIQCKLAATYQYLRNMYIICMNSNLTYPECVLNTYSDIYLLAHENQMISIHMHTDFRMRHLFYICSIHKSNLTIR